MRFHIEAIKKILALFALALFIHPSRADHHTKEDHLNHLMSIKAEIASIAGNGYAQCSDGRYALLPIHQQESKKWLVYFFGSLEKDSMYTENIKESISSVKSYIFVPDWAKEASWNIDDYDHLKSSEFYRRDWKLATKLFRDDDLPITNNTYTSSIYKAGKLEKAPYVSTLKGFKGYSEADIKSFGNHKFIEISYKNKNGKQLSWIMLAQGQAAPGFAVRTQDGTLYSGLTKEFGNYYKNFMKHPSTPYTRKAISINICPENKKNIIVRSVFPVGYGFSNEVGNPIYKYIGLQVIEYELNTSFRKTKTEDLPSF